MGTVHLVRARAFARRNASDLAALIPRAFRPDDPDATNRVVILGRDGLDCHYVQAIYGPGPEGGILCEVASGAYYTLPDHDRYFPLSDARLSALRVLDFTWPDKERNLVRAYPPGPPDYDELALTMLTAFHAAFGSGVRKGFSTEILCES
ncbi:MAG: hypothetical protein AB7L41_01830 [Flavobacteriaceae bacterium]